MKKFRLLCCFLTISARLGAHDAESARLVVNELLVESVVSAFFLTNSNNVVEVTADNYPELYQSAVDVSAKAGIDMPLLFLITKRHPVFFTKANAFAVGSKDVSAVFVGSWLLDELSVDEVRAVLAHEITHVAKGHAISKLKFVLGSWVVTIATAILGYKLTGYEENCPIAIRWMAAILGGGFANKLFSLLSSYHERKQEKEADLGAVELTGNLALIGALEKREAMVKKYCPYSTRKSTELTERLFANHPLTDERVAYIQERGLPQTTTKTEPEPAKID